MKILLPIVLLGGMVAGCAGFLSSTLTRKQVPIVFLTNHPMLYTVTADGTLGDSIGVSDYKQGDTAMACAVRYRFSPRYRYYMIPRENDTVYVIGQEQLTTYIVTLDDQIAASLGRKFRLHRSEDPTAWARATVWISKHSDMKIQTSSESLIQTYNPIKASAVGYIITRVPMGDSVEYEINCLTGSSYSTCDGVDCAFYMKMGRERG